MSERAAVDGDYADFKIVKTRSIAQIVVEIPIEKADAFLRAFGVPIPGKPAPVALARLNAAASNVIEGPRRWSDMLPAQQAGIRCAEPAFWKFLQERGEADVKDSAKAATYVRLACGVHSRAAIMPGTPAADRWTAIDDEYSAWLRAPEVA